MTQSARKQPCRLKIDDPELIAELEHHAARLQRSRSWVARRCVQIAMRRIQQMTAPPEGEKEGKR